MKTFSVRLATEILFGIKVYPFAKVNFQSQNLGLSTSLSYITTDVAYNFPL